MKADQYIIRRVPKRSGGWRTIEEPVPELKAKQRQDLPRLRRTYRVSPFAHGFHRGRSIVTAALPHVGKAVVGRLDIKDFFPSVKLNNFLDHAVNISGVEMTYEQEYNSLLLHFLEEDREEPRLPQGAPASPFLANAYMYKADYSIAWYCYRVDVDYTRYADDLIFSGPKITAVLAAMRRARKVLERYGLEVNEKKTKVMPQRTRQWVCGLIVNRTLNAPRAWRKRLRAEVHQHQLTSNGELPASTRGKLAFLHMIEEGRKLKPVRTKDVMQAILMSKELREN